MPLHSGRRLVRALGLYPAVEWGVGGYVRVTQYILVVCLKYCAHVFCTAVWQIYGVLLHTL